MEFDGGIRPIAVRSIFVLLTAKTITEETFIYLLSPRVDIIEYVLLLNVLILLQSNKIILFSGSQNGFY